MFFSNTVGMKALMGRSFLRFPLAVSILLSGGNSPFSEAGGSPGEAVSQSWQLRRLDPQTQLLEYYRQYPDRYIRVSKESWKYEERSRTALHSFTLRNTASVRYCDVELSFNYLTPGGKVLHIEQVKLPNPLEALRSVDIFQLKVKKVPGGAETAVVRVAKALICR
ncbi:MAG: hypothetical protein HXY20_07900 [Acidobacteria bacterium]|nr:hypothetical protein [Acidobacteriota bacterium]